MRRALIVAAVFGLILFILWLAQENLLLTSLTVVGLVLACLLWWWAHRPEAAASLVAVVLTLVSTSEVTFWIAARVPAVDVLQLGFGFWIFTLVTAVGVWSAPRHPGNRAVTLCLTGVILTVASVCTVLAPGAVPVAGFVLAALVVLWRTRRPRLRPRAYEATDDHSADVRGVRRTWERLEGAEAALSAAGVELIGPQRIGRAEVELLLRTPDGLVLVQTRRWGGRIRLSKEGDYTLDGDSHALTSRLAPIVELVRGVRRGYGGSVSAIVVLGEDTDIPDDEVAITVLAGKRASTRITLLHGERLVTNLTPSAAAR